MDFLEEGEGEGCLLLAFNENIRASSYVSLSLFFSEPERSQSRHGVMHTSPHSLQRSSFLILPFITWDMNIESRQIDFTITLDSPSITISPLNLLVFFVKLHLGLKAMKKKCM